MFFGENLALHRLGLPRDRIPEVRPRPYRDRPARYGFIEEDRASAADGRERPWRIRLLVFTMEDRPDDPAVVRLASRLLAENIWASAEEQRARYQDRKSEYPADWQAAAGEIFSVAQVTPAELNELRAKLLDVLNPYMRIDQAERPSGALPVQVMLDLSSWFRPEEGQVRTRGSWRS